MSVLALDPASIRTGYAYFRGPGRKVHDAGYLSGKTGKDGDKEPTDRILTMCHELRDLVEECRPDLIAIEVTSGHVGRKRHKGGGAGLATYGMAVGGLYVYATVLAEERILDLWPEERMFDVWPVKENTWTGTRSKGERRAEVAMKVPRYKDAFAQDRGGDVADAIGIGWWALAEIAMRKAVSQR